MKPYCNHEDFLKSSDKTTNDLQYIKQWCNFMYKIHNLYKYYNKLRIVCHTMPIIYNTNNLCNECLITTIESIILNMRGACFMLPIVLTS